MMAILVAFVVGMEHSCNTIETQMTTTLTHTRTHVAMNERTTEQTQIQQVQKWK